MSEQYPIRWECEETSVVCPNCRAAVGARCTVPRDGTTGIVGTGTTTIPWFHRERLELIAAKVEP
jgi:hypothetical protein